MKTVWKFGLLVSLMVLVFLAVTLTALADSGNQPAPTATPNPPSSDWQPILPFDGSISSIMEESGSAIDHTQRPASIPSNTANNYNLGTNSAWEPMIPYDGSLTYSYAENLQGSVIYPPREVMDFSLPSTTGENFTLSEQGGKLVMIYFGYLTCPDVCPTTMADLLRAYREIGEPKDEVTVVFITIDPERDTLDYMKRYVNAFHADFIGVRPESEEQLDELLASYGVTKQRREVDSAVKYLIDHSASVLMIAPDGRMIEQFPFGVPYTELSHDLKVLMEYMLGGEDVAAVMGEVTSPPDPSREYRIVIPEGSGAMIQMGQDPGVIPLKIELTLGEQDILVLENHDTADYLVGGIWVAPQETVKKQFYQAQTFVGLCTVTVGRDLIEIIVSDPNAPADQTTGG